MGIKSLFIKRLIPLICCVGQTVAYAQEGSLVDDVDSSVQSCVELFAQIRESDCGQDLFRLFEGGNLSVGVAFSSFGLDIQDRENDKIILGNMSGTISTSPYYAINTKPGFFRESNFGYEFSFSYGQSTTIEQKISRNRLEEHINLGSYVIGSMLAAQANLFYAFGANDETPKKYFLAGLGVGAGYGSVLGRTYLTEDESNDLCYLAGSDYVGGNKAAASQITQHCELFEYNRSGFGGSARIQLGARYEQFLLHLDSSFVGVDSSNGSQYKLAPSFTTITLSYLIDVF